MRIAFFVNSIEDEFPHYTTTVLAFAALSRGHEICYVTPGDFVLRPDDTLMVSALGLPSSAYKKLETLHKDLQGDETKVTTIDVRKIDVIFLRNDPSQDAAERPWAAHVGAMFGRLAVERGVLVVNDPGGLTVAQNKLYFQDFPEAVRPTTLISKSIDEIRAFIEQQPKGAIVKPLQGSGGKNVSPASLEAALKAQPLIGQACAIGDKEPYVAALLVLDSDVAPAWAAQHEISAVSLAELAEDPQVLAEVEREVEAVNRRFSHAEQIRRFTVLGQEWLPDSEELTPTMKIKRRGIEAKYAAEIAALYAR
jgi:hypothetical protein